MDSSLYVACCKGNKDEAKKSLNFKSVKYEHPILGDTPLHHACKQGWLDIVMILIERYGCDPNVKILRSGQNLLHYACGYGHIDIVEYLINKQHLNPLLRDNQLEPLDHALNYNQTDIAAYLCQHCLSSDEMLSPKRIKTTIKLIETMMETNPFNPKWKTADGCNILQLVRKSEMCIAYYIMPSTLVLKIITLYVADSLQVHWKTADGDNLLELICQSKTYLSQIPSALLMKWLCVEHVTIVAVKISIPDSKTADGETLLQLVCRSQDCVSHVSTVVLSKWLNDTTLHLEEIIIRPEWQTANGDTLLQLICRSEICLFQMSSALLLMWLENTSLEFINVSTPDSKTADGGTFIQLILHSVRCVSQTPSMVLSKWLSDSKEITTNLLRKVDPNWTTVGGNCFFHALCQSKIEDEKVIELIHYFTQKDCNIFDRNGNTALHIVCQANKPALVSYIIEETQCDPNIRNKMGILPLEMSTNIDVIDCLCQHDQVAIFSETVKGWMSNRQINNATMLHMLQVLIDNHRFKTEDGSTLLHITCITKNSKFRGTVLIHYLLTKAMCDPNSLDRHRKMPLQLTSNSSVMKKLVEHGGKMTTDVFKVISSKDITESIAIELFELSMKRKTMLWKPNDLNSDGDTTLHHACKQKKEAIINYLLTKAQCDPNCLNSNGQMPLQLTSSSSITEKLVKHGAKMTTDVVFKVISSKYITESRAIELFEFSISKKTMLWNPNDLSSAGHTALHLACKHKKQAIINYLLTKAQCDPNCIDNNGKMPLQWTSSSNIMEMLVEHGAKMTTDVVFKVISSKGVTDSGAIKLFELSLRRNTMLWNPNDLNSDGCTALQLACKLDKQAIIDYLLTSFECDPNANNQNPLQSITNLE